MDVASIVELLVGVLYVLLGAPLLRRAGRTQGLAERFMGAACLLIGVSYLLYDIPFALEVGSLALPLTVAGRLVFDVAMLGVALFNWRFFHGIWAASWVWVTALLLLSGLALSALSGDWDGYAPLQNVGFWLEWAGQLLPMAWLGVESGVQYTREKRRAALDLADPMRCNRFLLWGLFALLQIFGSFVLVPMYVHFEILDRFSPAMDFLLGGLEVASVAALWLAFFPPAPYCRWLARSAPGAA